MTWPNAQIKTNFDAAGDDPKQARSDFAGNVDKFNQMRSHVSSYIQGLLDDADAAAARATLGAQPLDATLTSLAAVAGVAGDVLYASGTDAWARLAKGTNGEFLKLASGIPSWASIPANINHETAFTSTSGATHDYTGLAAGISRITLMLNGVSLSADGKLLVQIGDSGGLETSDYDSGASIGTFRTGNTSGFLLNHDNGASVLWSGRIVFNRLDGNEWVSNGGLYDSTTDQINLSAGNKTLTAELDRLRILNTGAGNFDAGTLNIFTE